MSPSICTASAGARPASTLSFESHTIRIVTINGEPWFVASDICRAIGIGNPTKALQALDDDDKALTSIQGLSRGNDLANIVSESGMYTLVLRCREAVKPRTGPYRFRRWVTREVLPSIRKTGRYESAAQPSAPDRIDPRTPLLSKHVIQPARLTNLLANL
ncbi:BRO-N domain-containing protein [Burkholderia ambifaria]|uniref:BRO-N domain-containing protein n=1 Tax=Burkholderia ambifaria TaxID=152480 RepID=UPI00158C8955|nr:Bro-N domain-containing protein [Burkholderia ambifaria]